MAIITASNSITVKSGSNGTYTVKADFTCDTANDSLVNNTSKVTCTATLTAGTGAFSSSSKKGTLEIYWHDNKENKDVLIASKDVSALMSGSITVSGSKTVSHNDDGTLSGYAIAKWTKTGSIYYNGAEQVPSSGTVSTATKALTTIARASEPTLSVTEATLGSTTVTINTNKKSTGFTHVISYLIGSAEVEIASSVVDSTSWIPPLIIANNFPNNIEGNITIKCKTYNGTTLVGTKDITLKVLIPSSVIPSISTISVVEADTTMISKNWGVYVQGKSKLNVNITAVGSYGSTIKSYKVTGIDSDTFSLASFISNVLKTAGTKTITVVVTDTRGRTCTKTIDYICVAYSVPTLEASVQRCQSNGTLSSDGTYLMYSFKASISPVNNKNNIQKYEIGYKTQNSSTYTYKTIASSGYSLNQEKTVLSGVTFSNTTQYDIIFRVTDAFGTPVSVVKTLGTVADLMNFNASGKSMAFGKASEATANETKLEIALDAYFSKSVNIGNTTLQKFIEDIINGAIVADNMKKYHVGKIVLSTENVNPATYLGFGKWELWGAGRVPVGVDASQEEFEEVEKTGGEKTHILTSNELPKLTGQAKFRDISISDSNTIISASGIMSKANETWSGTHAAMSTANKTTYYYNNLNISFGSNQAHNNLQPYITCYMWKRTE